jgi:hypothetical protein
MTIRSLLITIFTLLVIFVGAVLPLSGSTGAYEENTPTPFVLLEVMSDGTWRYPPTASPTIPTTATATASPLPSNTPTPTATVTPTETPFPTPTQQSTKPGPTPTVQPIEEGCYLTSIAFPSLNVRSSTSAASSSNIVGKLLPRASWHEVLHSEFVDWVDTATGKIYRTDEWLRIVYQKDPYMEGWVAGFYNKVWLVEFSDEAACLEIRFPEIEKRGLHSGPQTNNVPVMQAINEGKIGPMKGVDGAETIVQYRYQTDPNALIVWRNLCRPVFGCGDGPPGWGDPSINPVSMANMWFDYNYAKWDEGGILPILKNDPNAFVEYVNELAFAGDWEIQFHLQMMRRATAQHICLGLFSFGYGNPLLKQFKQLEPVLEEAYRIPCKSDGTRHVIAVHSYSYYGSGIWLFDLWRTFRSVVDSKY